MEVHPLYGPVVIEKDWVPAPSFLLRRARFLRLLGNAEPGELLEIGCGGGTLLYEMSTMGFRCQALESSSLAFDTAVYVNQGRAQIHASPRADWHGHFNYLVALEVLEHIEDDHAALLQWYDWLKPGGSLLLSVPAHQNKWTVSDEWAGHYRRYEKAALLNQLQKAGFTVTKCESWGFPLSNLLLSWRARVQGKQLQEQSQRQSREVQKQCQEDNMRIDSRKFNNDHSGIDRTAALRLYPLLNSLPGTLIMRAAFGLQHLTTGRDWGIGYLVHACKPSRSS